MKKVITALLIVIMMCWIVDGAASATPAPPVDAIEGGGGTNPVSNPAPAPTPAPSGVEPKVEIKSSEPPADSVPVKTSGDGAQPVTGGTAEQETPLVQGAIGKTSQTGTTATIGGTGVKYYVDQNTGAVYAKPGTNRREVPEAVARAAETNGGITGISGNTYTCTPPPEVDEGIEADYQTTTTVSITDNGDGTYVRTVDQTTKEKTGLLERGDWNFVERTVVSTEIGKATDDGKEVKYMSGQLFTSYDENGKQGLTESVEYYYSPRTGKSYQTSASVTRADGSTAWMINEKGEETYYNDKAERVSQSDAKLTKEQRKAIDKASVRYVNNGAAGWNAWHVLGTARSLGRFMHAYDEYSGLRQYSAIGGQVYDQQVQERKARIQQEFCIASGVTNCIISNICGKKFNIVPGNTLAGRGPGGQFVTSARINGESSLPVELEGLSRQQLIDLFGNTTVVAGKKINLTDPAFNPATLGKFKLRLYHVQFMITNNNDKYELSYNVKFKRGEPGSTTSYGTPVKEAKWYPADQKLEKGATATNEIYKWSPGEYSDVCLTFTPPLPSGSTAGKPQMVNEFCAPFTGYKGGPTEIAATLEEAMAQGAETAPTGVAGESV